MRRHWTGLCLLLTAAVAISMNGWGQDTASNSPLAQKTLVKSFIEEQSGNFKLNLAAYEGITFAALFGTVPNLLMPPNSGPVESCVPVEAPLGQAGVSVGGFFRLIQRNLEAAAPEYAAIETIIKERVMPCLSETVPPDNTCLGSWRVRSFFEENIATKYAGTPVMDQFFAALCELETAGLTIPWLLVAQNDQCEQFRLLMALSPFQTRLARMTYPHFFILGLDDPLVDQEIIELTQRAIDIGLFGAFHVYRGNSAAKVECGKLSDSVKAAYSCCNKTTKVCQASPYSTHNCSMCGATCCLGSRWCP